MQTIIDDLEALGIIAVSLAVLWAAGGLLALLIIAVRGD